MLRLHGIVTAGVVLAEIMFTVIRGVIFVYLCKVRIKGKKYLYLQSYRLMFHSEARHIYLNAQASRRDPSIQETVIINTFHYLITLDNYSHFGDLCKCTNIHIYRRSIITPKQQGSNNKGSLL